MLTVSHVRIFQVTLESSSAAHSCSIASRCTSLCNYPAEASFLNNSKLLGFFKYLARLEVANSVFGGEVLYPDLTV